MKRWIRRTRTRPINYYLHDELRFSFLVLIGCDYPELIRIKYIKWILIERQDGMILNAPPLLV